jgi:hypothetical protein
MTKKLALTTLVAAFSLGLLVGSAHAQPPALYPAHSEGAALPETAPAARASATETRMMDEEGLACTTIDFEGVGDLAPIPAFDGINSPGWLGIIDADAGGSGNFAFEPSPETIAFWLGGGTGTGSSRDIDLDDPAAKLEFSYASFVTIVVTAFDVDGNVVDSAVGPPNFNQGPGGDPTGSFNKWDPIDVESDENNIVKVTVSGAVNQTGIDDLRVCRQVGIDTVEFTQAIQELQDLEDLEADLADNGEPPVPMVRRKPAVVRVYFKEVQTTTSLEVDFEIAGVATETRAVTVQPNCDRDEQRERDGGCRSEDFYFVPPAGGWTADFTVRDDEGNEVQNLSLDLESRSAEPIALAAVQVCDSTDTMGNWRCVTNYNTRLATLASLLRKISPTDRVRVVDSGDVTRRDTAVLITDADGNGTISSGEAYPWWDAVRGDVDDLFGFFDALRDLFGLEDRRYYGMARPVIPGGILGIAAGIPSRGAVSITTANDLGADVSQDTVAHETFHTMGRRHTNTAIPVGNAPGGSPGCHLSSDSGTDWPYPDNRIRSGDAASNELEVGFDVGARQILLPNTTFDIMSYCVPVWVSAFTYNEVLDNALDTPFFGSNENATVVGPFWLLSGLIVDGAVDLRPIFEIETAGPDDELTGDHTIEVVDSVGTVLFTRRFDPATGGTRVVAGESDVESDPSFSQLVPVQASASAIRFRDPAGTLLGEAPIVGVEPSVVVTFPLSGQTLSGVQTIDWFVTDADSTDHVFWVQYSPAGGVPPSWRNLAFGISESEITVDFDALPGTAGNGLIRVVASDGINSGVGLSGAFSVPTSGPSVGIVEPSGGEIYKSSELVWLQGFGFDPEDGTLDDEDLAWESDLAGALGTGESLPVAGLPPGTHVVTLTGTDEDGNTATATVTVVVAGAGPSLDLAVVPQDTLPTTCVEVTIDAIPGSVDLARVDYSLDGGESFVEVALNQLPFRFIIPGSGFFHVIARSYDAADQLAAADDRIFIDSPCPNAPPTADPGEDRTLECDGNGQAETVLDGSASSDPDGDPLTCQWSSATCTIADPSACVTNASCPLGANVATLVVNDGQADSSPADVAITVEDTTPPEILAVSADPSVLWPPNHKMVSVEVTIDAIDLCDSAPPVCEVVSVDSNEPPGDNGPDAVITGPTSLMLRAERLGKGDGRVYTIGVQCTDTAGNASSAATSVFVPHDQGRNR